MPTIYDKQIQIGDRSGIKIIPFPNLWNQDESLLYSGGSGKFFNTLPPDRVTDGGLWYGGNPLNKDEFKLKSCNNLNVNVTKLKTYSQTKKVGLFNKVNNNYYWNNVNCDILGIYENTQSQVTPNGNANIVNIDQFQNLFIKTNDVNIVPRIGDYIVINEVDTISVSEKNDINNKLLPMKFYRNKFMQTFKILSINLVSGNGPNVVYSLELDKSVNLKDYQDYAITLLNRKNTSIQKDLYYDLFQPVEVYSKQLLGDNYDNQSNPNIPYGDINFLNYLGSNGLGYLNLVNHITNSDNAFFLDIQDDIKDRISLKYNDYSSEDIHFEMQIPSIFIDEADDNGNPKDVIFITRNLKDDSKIGYYQELFVKGYNDIVGYVFNDLRLICISNNEFIAALSYNGNRNYILPSPLFQENALNTRTNNGINISLTIANATNTSPIEITTVGPHGLLRGTKVHIENVLGNTAANGIHYIDIGNNADTFKLYSVMPTYNNANVQITPGVPVMGNNPFIPSLSNPGKVRSANPDYNYFFTYAIKSKEYENVRPYTNTFNFNFVKNGQVDNNSNDAFLQIFIPRINTSNLVGNNTWANKGFNTLDETQGYGIEIIIGQYVTNPDRPSEIIGTKDLYAIPIQQLTVPFNSIAQNLETGLQLQISLNDYIYALNNQLEYNYINRNWYVNNYPNDNANYYTGAITWFLGGVDFKNEVEMNRAEILINVPADKWNSSTNITYNSEDNIDKVNKYITEVALYDEKDETKPLIYTKICPPIKKISGLDLNIGLKIDF